MKRAAWLAGLAALITWLPLTLWRGLAQGRSFRIGAQGQESVGPLIEGVIQVGFVMLAPSLFVGLLVFALLAWREERRMGR
jgi:hypothetical protein